MKKIILLFALLIFLFTACSDDDPVTPPNPQAEVTGVYVLSEGKFQQNNASLAFYNLEKDTVLNYVYEDANGKKMGDNANDMDIYKTYAYVAVSNSNKIEVVDLKTFKSVATINMQGKKPRGIAITDDGKGFVTSATKNKVYTFNANTFSITDSVECGAVPESITITGGKVFVANSGWGADSTVTVIDAKTNTILKTIKVGYNPVEIITADGFVYVAAIGGWGAGQSRKGLYKIDATNLNVVDSIATTTFPSFPGIMCVAENNLLIVGSAGAQKVSLDNFVAGDILIANSSVVTNGSAWSAIYGIAYDAKEKKIYCGNPKDFNQAGDIAIFDLSGNLVKRFDCGINPGTIKVVNP